MLTTSDWMKSGRISLGFSENTEATGSKYPKMKQSSIKDSSPGLPDIEDLPLISHLPVAQGPPKDILHELIGTKIKQMKKE